TMAHVTVGGSRPWVNETRSPDFMTRTASSAETVFRRNSSCQSPAIHPLWSLTPHFRSYFFAAFLEGNRTVAEPGSVISPRWFSPQHSISTRCSSLTIYFLMTLPFIQWVSPTILKRFSVPLRFLIKPSSPIQFVTTLSSHDILWQP